MIALYLDEDSSTHQLIWALRSRGFDVMTSFEAKLNGRSDEVQLAFAAIGGRMLLTSNARDYARIHRAWASEGRTHTGIVLIPQQRYSTGEIVRRLLRMTSAGVARGSDLYYLSNF